MNKLGNLITYISRGITPKYIDETNAENTNPYCIVLNQKCIRNYEVNILLARKNDLSIKKVSNDRRLRKFDILINSTGTGTLGRVAQYLDDSNLFVTIDAHITVIRPDSLKIDPMFMGYLLKSKQSIIEGMAQGSTGQTELYKDSLINLELNYNEDINYQKRTAEFLRNIDDKIQLNTQTNQTLEQIAQTIYKSWFVDYEPTRAKAAVLAAGGSKAEAESAAMRAISGKTAADLAALKQQHPARYQQLADLAAAFPSALVPADNFGEIPEGWEVKKVGDIVERLKNKQKLSKNDILHTGLIPVFEQGSSLLMGYHDGNAAFDASIDNPKFIFGDHTCIMLLTTEPFSIYQNIIPLKGKGLPTYWVYSAVIGKQKFQEYRRHWMEFIVKDIVVPNNIYLCDIFSGKIKYLFNRIDKNRSENKYLIEVRDTILPKIINGEIL